MSAPARMRMDGTPRRPMTPAQLAARDAIRALLTADDWRMEDEPCRLCGGRSFTTVSRQDVYGLPVSMGVCRACGFIQQAPMLRAEDCLDLYRRLYPLLQNGDAPDNGVSQGFFRMQRNRGERFANMLEDWGVPVAGRRVAEVGCASGGVLAGLRDRGATVFGCDFARDRLDFARAHDIPVVEGGLSDLLDALSEPPDIVVYSHVLEHIHDLDAELARLAEALPQGAFLFVEVPGLYQVPESHAADFAAASRLEHLSYFTRQSLDAVVGRHGFSAVAGTEYVDALYRRDDGATPPPTGTPHDHDTALGFLAYCDLLLDGLAAQAAGDADRALVLYQDAARAFPTHADAWRRIATLLMQRGQAPAAIDAVEIALGLEPPSLAALLLHTRLMLTAGMPEEAETRAREALRRDPGNAAALRCLWQALANRGDPERAVAEAHAALRRAPDSPVLIGDVGALLIRLRRHDEAETLLRPAIARFADAPILARQLASALLERGRAAEALPLARRAAVLSPRDAGIAWLVADCCLRLGSDREETVAALRRVLELAPRHVGARKALDRIDPAGLR